MTSSPPSALQLLKERAFAWLWAGQTVSLFGSQITQLALPLAAVLQLQASPLEMGVLSAVQALPMLLFGLAAGAWVDRHDQRPILLTANLVQAAALLTIPLAALFGRLTFVQLAAVSLVSGIAQVFFDTAYQSFLPSTLPRSALVQGNGLMEQSRSAALIGGKSLAGLLIDAIGAPFAIAFDALSFLVCAAFIGGLPEAPEKQGAKKPAGAFIGEVREGIRAVLDQPLLFSIARCAAALNLFCNATFALRVLYCTRDLHVPAAWLGVISGLGSIGLFAGATLASRMARRFGTGPAMIGGVFIVGAGNLLLPLASGGLAQIVGVLVLASAVPSAGLMMHNVNSMSLRQAVTAPGLLGRVSASMRFFSWSTNVLGMLAAGAVAERIGMRATLFAAGLGAVASGALLLFSPVRALRQLPTEAAEPKRPEARAA